MRMTWRFDRGRRRFLRKAGAAAAATALGPLIITDRTIAQTRTLYVNSWGGSFTAAQDAAYFKPFTASTGIHIRTVTPVSYAKIKAQVQAGRYEFDMTSINSMQWLRASREGLAEPIDWTIFKKGTLPAEAIVANGYGVASNIQGTNLCYRRDKFPNGGPRSWADFWDVKQFPGARGLCINDSPRTLIFALLAAGGPADRLYPLDIDRAFKKLDQIKPHIKVWWREGNQSGDMIDAPTALELGMVNRVVPRGDLSEDTLKFAQRMALIAPEALATTKLAINRGADATGFRNAMQAGID